MAAMTVATAMNWRSVRRVLLLHHGRALAMALILVILAVLVPALQRPVRASTLPANFQESIVFSGLDHPTAVRFASDGRVFVAEKSGLIKVFSSLTSTTPTIFADLRARVDNYWDRGLLGLALDPAFPTRPYLYALYTHDAPVGANAPTWNDACPAPPGATTDGCMVSGRLSRLQASGNVMAGTEQVLIEDWCQQFPSHSIGDLRFGPDGALYVSGGDGASFNNVDYGQYGHTYTGDFANPCGDPPASVGGTESPPGAEGGSLRSQSLRRPAGEAVLLNGAILRVDPATGAGMTTNPLAGSSNPNTRRIIASGLRNPFRFTVRPGTDEVWVGDVGWNSREEVDRIKSARDGVVENFGWPCYEGDSQQSGYASAGLGICQGLYNQSGSVTLPYYSYDHGNQIVPGESCPTGGSSITGLAFYTGGAYPTSYNGALFFADHSRNCIWVMFPGSNGLPSPSQISTFVVGAANPVDLEIGPGGDLFYVDHDGGSIRRIQYFGGNQPPTAVINASSTSGPTPLTVSFDGTGSRDPDPGDGIASYSWDLNGDGVFDDSTSSTASYSYTAAGSYTVGLRVTDNYGATGFSTRVITAGNTPPIPTITAPRSSLIWKVGDTINFAGSAVDQQDGNLPLSALSWTIILNHCYTPTNCHSHLMQSFSGVASGSFPAPDHAYPSYLEVQLRATDSAGMTGTASVLIYPQTTGLTFQATQSGLQLAVNGTSTTTPFTTTVIVGSSNSVGAASTQILGGSSYTFSSWSDGLPQSHTVTAAATPATYTASYAGPSILAGDYHVEPTSDTKTAGAAEAFRTMAVASGNVTEVYVYVDKGNKSNQVAVALYSNTSGNRPGNLLWQGVLNNPQPGSWNRLAVSTYPISAGQAYWLAVLSPIGSGTLRFRKATTGGATSLQRNLSALPATWGGKSYDTSVLSAYMDQSA